MIDPQGPGRWSLKRGMSGHDVAAVQIALVHANFALPIDGVYGVGTESAVFSYQSIKGLTTDGVCGPVTQEKFVRSQSLRFGKQLPDGMLPSIAANESGFMLGARTSHPSDAGYDLGPFQHSLGTHTPVTQENIRNALSVPYMARRTATEVLVAFMRYRTLGKVGERRCWELAVLRHNWPVAADRLAAGMSIFVDPARDDVPQQWVIDASGGRLRTAREWCASYVAKATALVGW